VYVQWADAANNWSAAVASNTVSLNSHVPSAPTVAAYTNASHIAKVSITRAVADGDVNRVYIQLKVGACPLTPVSGAIPYVAGSTYSFALPGVGPWALCVWDRDLVNFSPPVAANVLLDVTKPVHGTAPFARFLPTTVSAYPVLLSWSAGSDTGSGIASYIVRRQIGTGAWATIGTTTARSLTVGLLSGRYYRFGIAPVDRAGNVGLFVYGPKFRAQGFQEASATIRYNRGWGLSTSPSYWGGHAKATRTRLSSATITFTGRNFALVASKNAASGLSRVYIDGHLVATINLYSATALNRQVVYTRAWTTSRRHVVRVLNLATAGHPRLTVDGYLILR
jgi:hypothetical protein